MDLPHDAANPPELIDAIDPTEDLANDITCELPDPNAPISLTAARTVGVDAGMSNCQASGDATIVTSGSVLRDRYILGQQLGNGGTAVISRARDLQHNGASHDGRQVAIKLLRPELRDRPQSIARLRREFRQTQSLAHPNIVQFFDLDCHRGTWFIAMELLNGEALGRRLRRTSPRGLPAGEALRIAAACGDALAFAHDRGVTHGDVKPDNVFVTATDEVRLLDFGVAQELALRPDPADRSTSDRVVAAATRAYASPEVLTGQDPEPRDDVFSLACVIYEMLAGRHPYGRRGANEARDARLEIEPLPGFSTRQWRALAAGLAWSREQRPANVCELLRALGADAPARLSMQRAVALPVRIAPGSLGWLSCRRLWRSLTPVVVAAVLGMLIGRFGFDTQSVPQSVTLAVPATGGVMAGGPLPVTFAAGVGAAPGVDAKITMPRVAAPAPAGRVSFDTELMWVSQRAVAAAIPVRRLDHAGRRAKVVWRAIDGTAVMGRDYGGPQSGVASFGEGHTFRMIYVPILSDAQSTGIRSFTVELTDASPGASLGSRRRVVVTIGDDG